MLEHRQIYTACWDADGPKFAIALNGQILGIFGDLGNSRTLSSDSLALSSIADTPISEWVRLLIAVSVTSSGSETWRHNSYFMYMLWSRSAVELSCQWYLGTLEWPPTLQNVGGFRLSKLAVRSPVHGAPPRIVDRTSRYKLLRWTQNCCVTAFGEFTNQHGFSSMSVILCSLILRRPCWLMQIATPF